MEITKAIIDGLKEAFSIYKEVSYDEDTNVRYVALTHEQSLQFEYLYANIRPEEFEEHIGFKPKHIYIRGDTVIDFKRYESDLTYQKDIEWHLDKIIPHNKDINGRIKYACFATFRATKNVICIEPTLMSSWRCLQACMNYPNCIICIRYNKHEYTK